LHKAIAGSALPAKKVNTAPVRVSAVSKVTQDSFREAGLNIARLLFVNEERGSLFNGQEHRKRRPEALCRWAQKCGF
jgi:hypothetical protein